MPKLKTNVAKQNGVAIVGPGRLGQALGRLLRESGVPVRFVAARNPARARRAARFIGGARAVTMTAAALKDARVLLLTVSDSAVESVARELAERRNNWKGKVILHSCGSLPASALDAFRRRGAAVGSLHPYQTIPSREDGVRNLTGCIWSVEGDAAAEKLSRRWVMKLKGKVFRIRAESKPLYHLSAFLVCPALVSLMDQSETVLRRIGVPKMLARQMLARFAAETARNFGRRGGRPSLTGPVARGDWATIRRHIAELRTVSPQTLPAYRELLRLMAGLAGRTVPSDCLRGPR